MPERNGQTDGQTDVQKWSSYYSGLHCEQCGHAVDTVDFKQINVSSLKVETIEASLRHWNNCRICALDFYVMCNKNTDVNYYFYENSHCIQTREYLEWGRTCALPSLSSADIGLHMPMFETSQRETFLKCTKIRFGPGLCHGPRWQSLWRSLCPLIDWKREILAFPLPIFTSRHNIFMIKFFKIWGGVYSLTQIPLHWRGKYPSQALPFRGLWPLDSRPPKLKSWIRPWQIMCRPLIYCREAV